MYYYLFIDFDNRRVFTIDENNPNSLLVCDQSNDNVHTNDHWEMAIPLNSEDVTEWWQVSNEQYASILQTLNESI